MLASLFFLLLGGAPARACECGSNFDIFSPGATRVGPQGVVLVELGDRSLTALSLRVDGRRLRRPVVEPYGLGVVRVSARKPLPDGAHLAIVVEATDGSDGGEHREASFAVGAAGMPAPDGPPEASRDRNRSFCGVTESLFVDWPRRAAGVYGFWAVRVGEPLPAGPPLVIDRVSDPKEEAVVFEVEACWGGAVSMVDGAAPGVRALVRPIGGDGALGAPVFFEFPPAPVETSSGLN